MKRVATRDAAGVRMLDDDDRRLGERVGELHRGVEVEEIVVRQLLALKLLERMIGREGRGLMRILAVSQLPVENRRLARPDRRGRLSSTGQESRDRRVVLARLLEHSDGAPKTKVLADVVDLIEEFCIERRIAQRQYMTMILRRGAQHRWTADVDLLDRFFDRHAFFRDRRFEWVQIHDDEIDRRNRQTLDVRDVIGVIAIMQNRAEHFRRERLYASAENFGSARPFRDRRDRHAGVAQMLGRAACRENLYASRAEGACEVDDAGFVGDGKNGAFNSTHSKADCRRAMRTRFARRRRLASR